MTEPSLMETRLVGGTAVAHDIRSFAEGDMVPLGIYVDGEGESLLLSFKAHNGLDLSDCRRKARRHCQERCPQVQRASGSRCQYHRGKERRHTRRTIQGGGEMTSGHPTTSILYIFTPFIFPAIYAGNTVSWCDTLSK